MRPSLFLIASSLMATPALAEQPAETIAGEKIEIPAELADPKVARRLTDMMKAVSKALLDLPVGELRAAAEGREPSPQEKSLTVGDLERGDGPDFEQDLERQIAEAGPTMQAAMQALASALPAMLRGVSQAREELERATANVPRPDYPER